MLPSFHWEHAQDIKGVALAGSKKLQQGLSAVTTIIIGNNLYFYFTNYLEYYLYGKSFFYNMSRSKAQGNYFQELPRALSLIISYFQCLYHCSKIL
jgi:hypothetical protein